MSQDLYEISQKIQMETGGDMMSTRSPMCFQPENTFLETLQEGFAPPSYDLTNDCSTFILTDLGLKVETEITSTEERAPRRRGKKRKKVPHNFLLPFLLFLSVGTNMLFLLKCDDVITTSSFQPPTICLECGVGETPEWRRGPQGPRT